MREEALCVRQIVQKYIRENGYDGLWCDDCACVTDDLAPCGQIGEDCEAGHKRTVPKDESCGCDGQGSEHWHIGPKETQE